MLKEKKSKLFFLVLLLFLFMLGANFALAVELRAPEINYPSLPFTGVLPPQVFLEKIQEGEISGEAAFPLYVKYFYYLFLMIAGLLALGIMVYGGFLYLISAGAPVKMITAKDQITGGILGLVILLSSYLILATINPQLAIFRLPGLEKVTLREIESPESGEEKFPTYFQIPLGIIIENAVLNEEAQKKLDYIDQTAEEIAKSAEDLYGLSEEIHSLVMKTDCGNSICSAGCSSTGCTGNDYQSQIKTAIEKTSLAISDLEKEIENISIAKIHLLNDFSQLEAAGFLMSKYEEVSTYNDLLSIKQYYEEVKKEVKIDSFPDWENIDLKMDGQIIKDPVTFYLDKEGNEDAIYLASTLPSSFYEQVDQFEPEEGWQPSPEGVPDVPLYKQTDPRWRYEDYDCGTTIAGAGCGPTSLAMILSYYTGRVILPDVIAALSLIYGHRVCDKGTAPTLFSDARILHGVKGSYDTNNSMKGWEEVLKKLNYGPIIISVGPSIFTGETHYIILKAKIGDIIYINDSYKNYYEVPEYVVRSAFRNGSGNYAWFGY